MSKLTNTNQLDGLLSVLDADVARLLDRVLAGCELSARDAERLFAVSGRELLALMMVADEVRRRTVGDLVTFVKVRNINFTNICTIGCPFCAFSRKADAPDAECLTVSEVVDRAIRARDEGCTEVCLQGGINPALDPDFYLSVVRAIRQTAPELHIHAFSPFEVLLTAKRAGRSTEDWLRALQEAGLDSMPGTAAEVFDAAVRKTIAPKKISTAQWLAVVKTAHRLGIPTTATIMYGHVDGPAQWAEHLALLRDLQEETSGFTEFVPLGFVHYGAPLYRSGLARPGPTGLEDVKMHAIARLTLDKHIRNIQVSWVKLGPKLAQLCLNAGANDFGGTLMEERISSSAGAGYGQSMSVDDFCRLAGDLGRTPAQRSTTYEILRVFDRAQ